MGATPPRSAASPCRSTASLPVAWAPRVPAARRTRPSSARRSSESSRDARGQGEEEVLQGSAALQALPRGLQAPHADGLRRAPEQTPLRARDQAAQEGAEGGAGLMPSAAVPEEGEGEAAAFLDLHVAGRPLLLPNAWDAGSAKLFESLGFQAIATTSSGHAATLGRLDGEVTREEALAHAAELGAATSLPVSADLESGFDDPAETVRLAVETGLAGCSIEDASR